MTNFYLETHNLSKYIATLFITWPEYMQERTTIYIYVSDRCFYKQLTLHSM